VQTKQKHTHTPNTVSIICFLCLLKALITEVKKINEKQARET